MTSESEVLSLSNILMNRPELPELLASILAGEFWGFTSTHFNIDEVEKHCPMGFVNLTTCSNFHRGKKRI